MEVKNLVIEKDKGICTVKLNSPQTLNSLNVIMLDELEYAFDQISNDDEVSVVVLTGEGKAFVAGADISYMSNLSPSEAKKFSEAGSRLFRKIETMNKVVIAAVNGFALGGGCELAMACDIRIASEKAKFGQPEVGLGIIPGFSGTQRLARLVGLGRAKELMFTGLHINADEAYRIGLVNKITDKDSLMEETYKMAEKIVSNSGVAVRYAKEAVNRGIETDIDTGIAYESNIFGLCFASEDQREGMIAFLEKRKPEFK
ncbi:short-chain-enoyl-CoA hydratase [Sedimentibacter hydroxybenzoicus DSM 7310]|uniref:Short-chain-enoyl-CoA hydratase n=1 Tax=Sedimentibacter hydroxybenzoicus DSM 7310 TaxID=1123245 RepID=A0A974BGQ3_SEDHY|nr:short-chain-enoyl-CoA hydratase [Sedimentibacter hydroxybenzoicus]NYB72792.1 short-chain-enoyl-CoA hydratase [Sedimentibacter hydroxybenzoicus DSM 7310]